ncbi:helix-turn-helix transcriptional regulator [Nonomuraea maritima]|uniref:helix-turn-helix transcriptional regulator n=1 Tax=Nonomuraea maritima TaxID=683260 RepID=UPI003711ED2A
MSPLFVGRDTELAVLGDALGRARAGTSSTVLVGGEAGVGKTRLLKEFTGRADDALVLVGGCLELGTEGLPFAPFTAVLRGLVRRLGRDGVAGLVPGRDARALGRLLPEFDASGGEGHSDGGDARARLFEQILGLLERLADERPVVLVVEDAHWADRSTRDLLTFLVRCQPTAARLLVVVTYRTDELHRSHPLRPLLAELGRVEWVSRVTLNRLTRAEAVALAESILRSAPSAADMDLIYARSEGNPLFVEALLSEADGADALPESLRDLLLAGVERLPDETQELLRVAGVGGQRIEHGLLSAVAGLDEQALARALRPAVASNVLVVDGEGYSFRHALIREAVHDDLLPGEHTRLHTRYAEALERDLSLLPAPRGAIALAHHWHSAHDSTWALVSAWGAAAAARRSAAYGEQFRMLSRVLELWDLVPDAAERIGSDRIDVLRRTAVVAHSAGEYERCVALAGAALALIDHDADPVRAAKVLRLRGMAGYDLGRPGYVDDLRRAAELTPADRPKLRAEVLELLARMLNRPEEMPEKLATARLAMEIAREVGEAGVEAHALISLACVGSPYATLQQLEVYAEARRTAERGAAYSALMRCAIAESDALEGAGRHERAAQVAREGIEEAARHGSARTSGTFLAINLAEPLVSLGRWDEALRVIEQAVSLAPPAPYRASLEGFAMDIALARGQYDRAEALLASSRGVVSRATSREQHLFPYLCREVRLLAVRGMLTEAVRAAERVLDDPRATVDARYAWPVLVMCARLAGAGGPEEQSAEAASLLRRVRAARRDLDVDGDLQRAYELTFTALVGPDPAEQVADPAGWRVEAYDVAAEAWAALRQPYAEAQCQEGAAEAALAAGDRHGAGERLARARELAAELGAAPMLERLDVFGRRAGIGATGIGAAGEPGGGQPLGLTNRELQVLREVADGRSNREIAARLFISAKTVSVHVSNILAKLGVATRGEAAATAYRLGLFTRAT